MGLDYNKVPEGWQRKLLETAMNRTFWGMQILAAGLIVVSSVMLVREWNQPSGDDVEFVVEVPTGSIGETESPLVMNIQNGTNVDIRIVGMNWC